MFRRSSEGELSGFAIGEAQAPSPPGVYRAPSVLKRVFDVLGATVCLIIFAPFFLFVAAGVLLTSRGSILYAQRRVGIGGKSIYVWKFRSMCANADAVLAEHLESNPDAKREWEEFHKLKDDPRITKFGRFIRKTSLDELPQFWNVIKGDMSLVGPRPVTAAERAHYGAYWAAYCSVRPGVSGLWQVSGRSHLSYDRRVQLDTAYVRNWTLWLDLKILVKTIKVVVEGDGSH